MCLRPSSPAPFILHLLKVCRIYVRVRQAYDGPSIKVMLGP